MKLAKALPAAAFAMCIPGMALRALHLLNGFDIDGLPVTGTPWIWYCVALLIAAAVLYVVLAVPLREKKNVPFEQLLGTENISFRMLATVAGLLLAIGGGYYFYMTITTVEESVNGWARILEFIYALATVATGTACLLLAKIQGGEMTENKAAVTLIPLLWSCLHLLVTYRMTCVDPKLPSFAFGLISDVLLTLALYQLARLLYSKPNPAALGACCAMAVTSSVADLGGYGLAWLMGVRAVNWTAKMVLRGGLTVSVSLLLAAELVILTRQKSPEEQNWNTAS